MSVFAQGRLKLSDASGPPALFVAVEFDLDQLRHDKGEVLLVDGEGNSLDPTGYSSHEELEARDVRDLRGDVKR